MNRVLAYLMAEGFGVQVLEFVKRNYTSVDDEGGSLGNPILYYCVSGRWSKSAATVEELITHHGANRYWNIDGKTLCHVAAGQHKDEAFKTLVTKYGLDPDARDHCQQTPLYYAIREMAEASCERRLTTVLECPGVNPNIADLEGNTLLMLAVVMTNRSHEMDVFQHLVHRERPRSRQDGYKIARLFVEKSHASLTVQNKYGECALDLVLQSPWCEESSEFLRRILGIRKVRSNEAQLKSVRRYFEGKWKNSFEESFKEINSEEMLQEYELVLKVLEEKLDVVDDEQLRMETKWPVWATARY